MDVVNGQKFVLTLGRQLHAEVGDAYWDRIIAIHLAKYLQSGGHMDDLLWTEYDVGAHLRIYRVTRPDRPHTDVEMDYISTVGTFLLTHSLRDWKFFVELYQRMGMGDPTTFLETERMGMVAAMERFFGTDWEETLGG